MTILEDLPPHGDDIHVRQDGPRDAPALLLIHGSASSARSWDLMVPLLTGDHHVIRIDLLGHGRSAKPDDGDYRTTSQAARAGAVLDRLGVARAVVVGHSSGGYVATALAEQRPELVSALALIDSGPSLASFVASDFDLDPSQWPPTDAQLRELAASGFGSDDYPVPSSLLDEVRVMTFHSMTATMRASFEYLGQRPLPERLAELGKPLLAVYGELERRYETPAFADYGAVAGARVVMLPGVGHTPILEDPPLTAATLSEFVGTGAGTG